MEEEKPQVPGRRIKHLGRKFKFKQNCKKKKQNDLEKKSIVRLKIQPFSQRLNKFLTLDTNHTFALKEKREKHEINLFTKWIEMIQSILLVLFLWGQIIKQQKDVISAWQLTGFASRSGQARSKVSSLYILTAFCFSIEDLSRREKMKLLARIRRFEIKLFWNFLTFI